MRQRSDSVFLLTLVDLLVQVIFLALFLGAIHISQKNTIDAATEEIKTPKASVIVKVGILKVAELINELTKLVPIDQIMELSVLLPEFKNIETLKSALELAKASGFNPILMKDQAKELEKKSKQGTGLPYCSIGSSKKMFLLRFEGYEDHYILSLVPDEAVDLFQKIHLPYRQGDSITIDQFSALGKSLRANDPGCRYGVKYENHVNSPSSLRIFLLVRDFYHVSVENSN